MTRPGAAPGRPLVLVILDGWGLREERGTPARCCIHPLEWPARWLWIGTIALLGVADVVALILTRV